jgi:Zn-dependent protease
VTSELIAAVIVLLIMLLVAFPIHEFSHALAAWRLGDGTARLFGRLTLNPVAHFDPVGGSLLAISMLLSAIQGGGFFGFGWAKPTPVNPLNLRGGRQGEAIVALAGPASNLVLASIGGLLFRLLVALQADVPFLLVQVIYAFVVINLILMLFNLIPIPPLDGSRALFALLPPQVAWRWRPLIEQYGPILLLIAVFLPIVPGGGTLIGVVFNQVGPPLISLLLGG